MMNKKGLEDSLITWIGAFLIIVFFMLIYLGFVFAIFSVKELGRNNDPVFEESSVDLIGNSKMLKFFNSNVLIDGKEERVLDILLMSQDERKFIEVMKALEAFCTVGNTLFLEIPQGTMTTDGILEERNPYSLRLQEPRYLYYDDIIYKTTYNGKAIKIRVGAIRDSHDGIGKIKVWDNCK